jgi:hypothetical protein
MKSLKLSLAALAILAAVGGAFATKAPKALQTQFCLDADNNPLQFESTTHHAICDTDPSRSCVRTGPTQTSGVEISKGICLGVLSNL